MKKLLTLPLMLILSLALNAQSNFPQLDKSPMDMCYYPVDYPVLKIQNKINEPLVARIIYGRPQKNERTIFGDLVPYGEVWRLGANEATEIEFFKDVKVDGNKVPKGKYTMYAVPDTATWTIILNKETNTWGAFKYDRKQDVLRVNRPVSIRHDTTDVFTIIFEKNPDGGANIVAAWDNVMVKVPFSW